MKCGNSRVHHGIPHMEFSVLFQTSLHTRALIHESVVSISYFFYFFISLFSSILNPHNLLLERERESLCVCVCVCFKHRPFSVSSHFLHFHLSNLSLSPFFYFIPFFYTNPFRFSDLPIQPARLPSSSLLGLDWIGLDWIGGFIVDS